MDLEPSLIGLLNQGLQLVLYFYFSIHPYAQNNQYLVTKQREDVLLAAVLALLSARALRCSLLGPTYLIKEYDELSCVSKSGKVDSGTLVDLEL